MKPIKLKHIGEIMQQIYDSEIHLKIGWFWDGGVDFLEGANSFDIWEGLNASLIRGTETDNMEIAFEKICNHLIAIYPNSTFTKWFKKEFKR